MADILIRQPVALWQEAQLMEVLSYPFTVPLVRGRRPCLPVDCLALLNSRLAPPNLLLHYYQ